MATSFESLLRAKRAAATYIHDDPNEIFRGIPFAMSDLELVRGTGNGLEWTIMLELHAKYGAPAIFKVSKFLSREELVLQVYHPKATLFVEPLTGKAI